MSLYLSMFQQVKVPNLFIDFVNNRVGIGTTTPAYTLDVVGDINAAGDLLVGSDIGVTADTDLLQLEDGQLTVNGDADVKGTLTIYSTILPIAPYVFSLGSDTARFYDVFVGNTVDLLDGCKIILGTGNDCEIYSSSDHLYIKNVTQDMDIVLGVDDGGVSKTITWDADVDKIKHSAGTFDFDDDDLTTSGDITAANLSITTTGEINLRDTDISIGSTLTDGILDMSADDSIRMFYDNADVGDATDGQSFYVYRRAAEGDDYLQMFIESNRGTNINTNRPLYLKVGGNSKFAMTTTGSYTYNPIYFSADNRSAFWGAGNDCSISYDGTDMCIDPAVVGSGTVDFKIAPTGGGSASYNVPFDCDSYVTFQFNGVAYKVPCAAA